MDIKEITTFDLKFHNKLIKATSIHQLSMHKKCFLKITRATS